MTGHRSAAIVPAAGLSSRMDGFKPLLAIHGKTMVAHIAELFLGAGVEDVFFVVGHQAKDLIPGITKASCSYVINHEYQQGMFSSIQAGVARLDDRHRAFFLLPVDIPLVRPETIRRLLTVFSANPKTAVCYPAYRLKRGHPPLINAGLKDRLMTYSGQGGMRGFLHGYEKEAVTVEVEDPFIRLDADTREDLDSLRQAYAAYIR